MAYIIPRLIIIVFALALKNRVPVYQTFIEGVEEGLKTVAAIFPALVAILAAAAMLRESGGADLLARLLAPLTSRVGIPSEILPLILIRPLSGGGSIGLLTDVVKNYGAGSTAARTACILCASTETTFYTIMVYFRRTKVQYTKRVLAAAVLGDIAGVLCAAWLGKINF